MVLDVLIVARGCISMYVNNFENKFLSSMAFLSGCFPIALIHFVRVTVIPYYERMDCIIFDVVQVFSISFIVLTIICAFGFYISINKRFSSASTQVKVFNLKRKDLFSSGALSCYVVPFLSLSGDNIQSTVSLVMLIVLFLIVFNNNIMFLYTPMIDILGYKILEGTIRYTANGHAVERQCNLMVKSDKNLYFEIGNDGLMEKLNESTFCFRSNTCYN